MSTLYASSHCLSTDTFLRNHTVYFVLSLEDNHVVQMTKAVHSLFLFQALLMHRIRDARIEVVDMSDM
jgi:hypothetical protein